MRDSLKIQRNKRKSKGKIKRKSLKRKNKKIYKGGTEQDQSNKIYPPPPPDGKAVMIRTITGYKKYSEFEDNSGIICYYHNSSDKRVWIDNRNGWIKPELCSGNCSIKENRSPELDCTCKVYQVKYYTYFYYPHNQVTQRPVYFNSWINPDENIPNNTDGFLDKGLMPKPVGTPSPQFVWYLTNRSQNQILKSIPISEVSNS